MTQTTDMTSLDPERVEREERYVRRRFWDKLRANLDRVPFLEDLIAAFYCATDSATPFKAKAMLFAALAYFIMPVDALPDWLLLAGFTDDAAVLAAAVQAVRVNMKDSHYEQARSRIRAMKGTAGA